MASTTTPGTSDSLVALIEAGFRPLRDAVGALAEAGSDQRTAAGWTLKEMIAHLAYWEGTVSPSFAALRAGRAEDNGRSVDDVNAEVAREARGRSRSEILARWDVAHARVLEAVRTMSEAELTDERFIDKVAGETYGHYPEHSRELAATPSGREDLQERGLDGW